jgi:hypothetical protein
LIHDGRGDVVRAIRRYRQRSRNSSADVLYEDTDHRDDASNPPDISVNIGLSLSIIRYQRERAALARNLFLIAGSTVSLGEGGKSETPAGGAGVSRIGGSRGQTRYVPICLYNAPAGGLVSPPGILGKR